MTLFEWRKNSTLPVHETDMIIQHICNLNRTDIILKEHNYELNCEQISAMTSLSQRRLESLEPIQYLLGYTYFYGRKFFVTPDVLIPRFDTETLIEAVKPIIKKKINESSKNPEKLKILDLCTGSGCIICTLAEDTFIQQNAAFSANDISEKALTVAKRNALGLPINFIQSDLFENINDTFDIIVSNPPYISQKEMGELDKEVFDFEPHLALFGGVDGLDIYTVSEIAELRHSLREVNSDVTVYKNTLMNIALKNKNIALNEYMEGPNAYLFADSIIEPIKVVSKFAKEHPALEIRVGFIDNEVVDTKVIAECATIPSMEGLLTMFAGGLIEHVRNLSIGLNLYAEKLEEGGNN